ncbi:MAG: polysaccharide deacetylase family protein [Bacteroidales bacterium]|nr:polysaccharide deacetylase family protein [Bacteroidales bacterium]
MYILTFDVEEWFHILDNDSTKTSNEWKHFESRIHPNIERIFRILKENNTKATFFCLGWMAEIYPEVIKEIVNQGFEIGSHTQMHQLVYEQTPKEFRNEVERSVKTLEDITGIKVKYFRAPGFSITEHTKWALEILAGQGIEIDCSVFPAPRAHGGFPSYGEPFPSIIRYDGIEIKELPINYTTVIGKPVIFSGGGYFRLFPYCLVKRWTKQSDYVMVYLHPRDFDPDQPVIKELSLFRKFKSYVGLKGAEEKLGDWLSDFEFVDVNRAVKIIDWEKAPVIEL